MYRLASEDRVVPSNKDTSRSTNRMGKLKFIETLWSQFLDGVIKMIFFFSPEYRTLHKNSPLFSPWSHCIYLQNWDHEYSSLRCSSSCSVDSVGCSCPWRPKMETPTGKPKAKWEAGGELFIDNHFWDLHATPPSVGLIFLLWCKEKLCHHLRRSDTTFLSGHLLNFHNRNF